MSGEWSFLATTQPSFKSRFAAGWPKYVKPPLGYPQPTLPQDMYWNPRAGDWFSYTTRDNDVQDRGWPRTDLTGYVVSADTTFDYITPQYLGLPHDEQPFACWDPRRGQWMYVAKRPTPGKDDRAKALTAFLASANTLHESGYIGVHTLAQIQDAIHNEQ
jgi:hypothetical protein